MKNSSKKRATTMDEVSKGYEQFIKGKKVNRAKKSLFNKAIAKAANPKPRDLG